MEYRLTESGRRADIKQGIAAQVVEYMKTEGNAVVNESKLEIDLNLPEARAILNKLVQAGYLSVQEESEGGGFGRGRLRSPRIKSL